MLLSEENFTDNLSKRESLIIANKKFFVIYLFLKNKKIFFELINKNV